MSSDLTTITASQVKVGDVIRTRPAGWRTGRKATIEVTRISDSAGMFFGKTPGKPWGRERIVVTLPWEAIEVVR